MTSGIERFDFDTPIHHGVVHNGTVYLTGQVAQPGQSAADQMREVLGKIDALLAGPERTRRASCTSRCSSTTFAISIR